MESLVNAALQAVEIVKNFTKRIMHALVAAANRALGVKSPNLQTLGTSFAKVDAGQNPFSIQTQKEIFTHYYPDRNELGASFDGLSQAVGAAAQLACVVHVYGNGRLQHVHRPKPLMDVADIRPPQQVRS